MAAKYIIDSTQPTIYQDHIKGIVNGVLVRFTLVDYNEVHEVRVPEMNVDTVKKAIEKILKQRDEIASLSSIKE